MEDNKIDQIPIVWMFLVFWVNGEHKFKRFLLRKLQTPIEEKSHQGYLNRL